MCRAPFLHEMQHRHASARQALPLLLTLRLHLRPPLPLDRQLRRRTEQTLFLRLLDFLDGLAGVRTLGECGNAFFRVESCAGCGLLRYINCFYLVLHQLARVSYLFEHEELDNMGSFVVEKDILP